MLTETTLFGMSTGTTILVCRRSFWHVDASYPFLRCHLGGVLNWVEHWQHLPSKPRVAQPNIRWSALKHQAEAIATFHNFVFAQITDGRATWPAAKEKSILASHRKGPSDSFRFNMLKGATLQSHSPQK